MAVQGDEPHFRGNQARKPDYRMTSRSAPGVTKMSPASGDARHNGDTVTPLVTPMSPKENNKKRINNRGKVPVPFSTTIPSRPAETTASPPPKVLSDTTKIILERRVAELRTEIAAAFRRDSHDRAQRLHAELVEHQTRLGFTPDDPPPKRKAPREEKCIGPATLSDWPSPEEVRATFNEARRSLGWPIKG